MFICSIVHLFNYLAQHMRSGYHNYKGIWGNPYYDDEATPLLGRDFRQRVFTASPALVAVHARNGWRAEEEYKGQEFDPTRWRLVERRWDHQHCRVCQFPIDEGMTFLGTADEMDILCNACYEHYIGGAENEAEP